MPSINAFGGKIPRIISRKIPPPTAVVIPKIITPKRSISFFIAVREPEIAKAIVPVNSVIRKKYFIKLSDFVLALSSAKVCLLNFRIVFKFFACAACNDFTSAQNITAVCKIKCNFCILFNDKKSFFVLHVHTL